MTAAPKRLRWLSVAIVAAIHDEALALFGGAPGIRDAGLLESALQRPRNVLHYEKQPTPFALAATLCSGIVRNHPFVDGNKRTALVAARTFLYLNGWELEPDEAEEVATMVAFAAREIDVAALAAWFEANSRQRASYRDASV